MRRIFCRPCKPGKVKAAARAPAVLFLHELNGMVALGETAVFGQPLYTVINPENALDLAVQK